MTAAFPVRSRSDHGKARGRYDMVALVSGGVDSAVALASLVDAGHNPFALTFVLPRFCGVNEDNEPRFASDDQTARDAAELCRRLGVSHAVLDLDDAFRAMVIAPFIDSYRNGDTPNPCVRCNPSFKFGLARDWAVRELGVRIVATGHYAGLTTRDGEVFLRRAHLHEKDQSYFLYRLPPQDLPDTRFPLAAFADKEEVRARARDLGLTMAETKDSQDICFLPDGDYHPLLARFAEPGPILDANGAVLGTHDGAVNFTIGQRKGFKMGFGKPMYVLAVDPARNAVVIGPRESTGRREVAADRLVIHDPEAVAPGKQVLAKIRSGGKPRPAAVVRLDDAVLEVRFGEEVFAPASGQHLVLYDESGVVLGGGQIVKSPLPGTHPLSPETPCRC